MGNLRVSPSRLRATRDDDTTIDLSLRDLKILMLLYEKRGQVVTRDMLFECCWGASYLPNSRSLDQHVSQLRKRIEPDPSNPTIIKTVHGVGYQYEDGC